MTTQGGWNSSYAIIHEYIGKVLDGWHIHLLYVTVSTIKLLNLHSITYAIVKMGPGVA